MPPTDQKSEQRSDQTTADNQRAVDDPPPKKAPREFPSFWRRNWPLLLLLLALAFPLARQGEKSREAISYSRFKTELRAGNVEALVAKGEKLRGEFREPVAIRENGGSNSGDGKETPASQSNAEKDDSQAANEDAQAPGDGGDPSNESANRVERFVTTRPPFEDKELMPQIMKHDVDLTSKGTAGNSFWVILLNLLPLLLLGAVFVLMLRGMSKQAGGIMGIGQSKARKFDKEHSDTAFEDVAGVEEPKRRLQEVVHFLTSPGDFAKLGCRVPKGVLLIGPPGTGKTLLARAVAGEADVPFFSITGSDFMEMFVGVGASRVRDLFRRAKEESPCIVFVDELDSIGRHRGAGLGGGHDEREQTLNQLLSEIDGFEPTESIVVIGASNRPDTLDPALMRPGRFDRRIVIDLPTQTERHQILQVHTKNVPLDEDVDLRQLARSMPGHSGADLNNLVNEAALLAARHGHEKVTTDDFSEARDQVLMGQRRGSLVLSDDEKRTVAIHEAGHALVADCSPEADPVEKVSIIPRGRALGGTQQLPEERFNRTEAALRARLRVMVGGRIAEEVLIGAISTGAADDLQSAGRLARQMISRWGMGRSFRTVAFEQNDSQVFLGEQIAQRPEYSEATAREIDLEIKELVNQCSEEARNLLQESQERLQALADALEEHETLEGEDLKKLLNRSKT